MKLWLGLSVASVVVAVTAVRLAPVSLAWVWAPATGLAMVSITVLGAKVANWMERP